MHVGLGDGWGQRVLPIRPREKELGSQILQVSLLELCDCGSVTEGRLCIGPSIYTCSRRQYIVFAILSYVFSAVLFRIAVQSYIKF